MTDEIRCGTCFASIPPEAWNQDSAIACSVCGTPARAAVFSAIGRSNRGAAAQALLEATEASCFYHPENRAHMVCDKCGRFLCAVCDLEVGARHICPNCLHAGAEEDSLANIEPRRVMWDTTALAIAVIPSILIWPTILTAPLAIFLSIYWWRRPSSLVPRTKVRFVIAILVALGQIVAWILLVFAVWTTANTVPPPVMN